MLISSQTLAQNFGSTEAPSTPKSVSVQKSDQETPKFEKSADNTKKSSEKASLDKSSDKTNDNDSSSLKNYQEKDDDFFVPESEISQRLNTPTIDGSVRGGQAFVAVDKNGNMKKVTNIFLFYDDFKIKHSFGDYTTCDVRFNIISNLDRQLSQIDIKLVWPDMTTTLSFSDIPPYTQTYYNYTLLGKGCYSMDKAPNIVVNRCRAKGLTSSECAHKIKWVSK